MESSVVYAQRSLVPPAWINARHSGGTHRDWIGHSMDKDDTESWEECIASCLATGFFFESKLYHNHRKLSY